MNTKLLKLIKRPPQIAYALGLGPIIGRMVLLLTTKGRKSGLLRVTPLQYEKINGLYFLGSARGEEADWYRNLSANPKVRVRVKNEIFCGRAEITTDPRRIADFLEVRISRHPVMLGMIFRANGYPSKPNRKQLEKYAKNRALVVIHPEA